MSTCRCRELTPAEFPIAYDVLSELRDQLTRTELDAGVREMRLMGYRLAVAEQPLASGQTEVVGVAGFALCRNLYHGRHLFLYDLVTAAAQRSRGHGQALLTFLEGVARAEGCGVVALVSGVQRTGAHRFYEEKAGFLRASHMFVRRL